MFIGRYVYLDRLDSEQNRTKYQPNSIELSHKRVRGTSATANESELKTFFFSSILERSRNISNEQSWFGNATRLQGKKSTGIGRNTMLQFRTIFEKDNNRDHSPYDLDLQNRKSSEIFTENISGPARGFLVFGFIHKVYGILVSQYLTISV